MTCHTLALSLLLALMGCTSGTDKETGSETDTDTDTDADTDTDTDTDTEAPVDADGDGATADVDCDDADPAVYPQAAEVCDGVDNDCDDAVDDADDSLDTTTGSTWYTDADVDGYGDSATAAVLCEQPTGAVDAGGDCDDADATVNPAGQEVCGGADEDCDGLVDDHDASVDIASATTWYLDSDVDGYGDDETGWERCEQPEGYVSEGADCDDDDPDANPGATEVCGGVDEDCDGLEDDADDSTDPTTAISSYADADADGYGDPATGVVTCEMPSGYTVDSTDCDDTAAGVNPAATEVCDATDVDDDCDGAADDADAGVDASTLFTWYVDADTDGYGDVGDAGVVACNAPTATSTVDHTDCDDTESAVNPGITELCNDGVDDDCDGTPNDCAFADMGLADADAKITGAAAYDYAGRAVASAGDVDGDGSDDVVVGAYGETSSAGAAYVVLGSIDADLGLGAADATYMGEVESDQAGRSVASAGDFDGDGLDDVLVGAPGDDDSGADAGAAYVATLVTAGSSSLGDVTVKLTGAAGGDAAGFAVAPAWDVSGDGRDDIVVGAYGNDSNGTSAGAAFIVYGGGAGGSLATADASLLGEAEGDQAGYALAGAGDVDGDGIADLLVGASHESSVSSFAGAAYLVSGPVSGTTNLGDATAKLLGEAADDSAGLAVAGGGDFNGDGNPDLVVGAPYHDGSRGAAYIVYGPVSGNLALSGADAVVTGAAASDFLGYSVASLGDVDGDGADDLVLGGYGADDGGAAAGAAYLVLGPVSGTVDAGSADATFSGESAGAYAGRAVAAGGDLDADGYADLLIGADGDATGGYSAGAVYVLYGLGL